MTEYTLRKFVNELQLSAVTDTLEHEARIQNDLGKLGFQGGTRRNPAI